jgi:hypothetical protein
MDYCWVVAYGIKLSRTIVWQETFCSAQAPCFSKNAAENLIELIEDVWFLKDTEQSGREIKNFHVYSFQYLLLKTSYNSFPSFQLHWPAKMGPLDFRIFFCRIYV